MYVELLRKQRDGVLRMKCLMLETKHVHAREIALSPLNCPSAAVVDADNDDDDDHDNTQSANPHSANSTQPIGTAGLAPATLDCAVRGPLHSDK